jgi:hypothetical protein
MTVMRFVAVLLVGVLLATAVQPAQAEAFDPRLIGLMAGAAVAVVMLTAVVIIGNATESGSGGDAALYRWYQQGGDDAVIAATSNPVAFAESLETLESSAGPAAAPQTP